MRVKQCHLMSTQSQKAPSIGGKTENSSRKKQVVKGKHFRQSHVYGPEFEKKRQSQYTKSMLTWANDRDLSDVESIGTDEENEVTKSDGSMCMETPPHNTFTTAINEYTKS